MIRHLCLLFSLVLASGSADDINAQFEKFVTKHNRTYDAAEYARRFVIFEANLKHIEAHKQRGVKSLGINHFADWEPEEWHKMLMSSDVVGELPKAIVGKLPKANRTRHASPSRSLRAKRQDTPTSFDYRDYGWVTSVKNQGKCGACWAFAAVGAVESIYLAYDGQELDLSEQQLIDCDSPPNSGCNGGVRAYALDFAKNNGLTTESAYAYKDVNGPVNEACKANSGAYNGISYTELSGESAIPDYVYNNGPVTFGFQVPDSFQYYDGTDVFADTNCATGHYHAMLIVGYNSNSWIVKNSWGTGFGDNGYVYYARDQDLCGIADRGLEGVLY